MQQDTWWNRVSVTHPTTIQVRLCINLDLKLELFHKQCDRAMLYESERNRGFSAMLVGAALNFYLTVVKRACTNIHEMYRKSTEDLLLVRVRYPRLVNGSVHISKNMSRTILENPFSDVLDLMVKSLQEIPIWLDAKASTPQRMRQIRFMSTRSTTDCSYPNLFDILSAEFVPHSFEYINYFRTKRRSTIHRPTKKIFFELTDIRRTQGHLGMKCNVCDKK